MGQTLVIQFLPPCNLPRPPTSLPLCLVSPSVSSNLFTIAAKWKLDNSGLLHLEVCSAHSAQRRWSEPSVQESSCVFCSVPLWLYTVGCKVKQMKELSYLHLAGLQQDSTIWWNGMREDYKGEIKRGDMGGIRGEEFERGNRRNYGRTGWGWCSGQRTSHIFLCPLHHQEDTQLLSSYFH